MMVINQAEVAKKVAGVLARAKAVGNHQPVIQVMTMMMRRMTMKTKRSKKDKKKKKKKGKKKKSKKDKRKRKDDSPSDSPALHPIALQPPRHPRHRVTAAA